LGDSVSSTSRANYDSDNGDTIEVGSYEDDKSPYGMEDMEGM